MIREDVKRLVEQLIANRNMSISPDTLIDMYTHCSEVLRGVRHTVVFNHGWYRVNGVGYRATNLKHRIITWWNNRFENMAETMMASFDRQVITKFSDNITITERFDLASYSAEINLDVRYNTAYNRYSDRGYANVRYTLDRRSCEWTKSAVVWDMRCRNASDELIEDLKDFTSCVYRIIESFEANHKPIFIVEKENNAE